MKTLMLTILLNFILFVKIGFSQGSITTQIQRDSLTNQLKTKGSDTSRVMILYQLCRAYSLINTAKAIQLGEEGLNLARKIDFQKGELFCLEATSFVYALTGSWEKGFKATYEALALDKKIAPEREAISVSMMSELYNKLGDVKEAFAWTKKAYQLTSIKKTNDLVMDVAIIMAMGGLYAKQNQLDSAYYFAQKTMEYCELNHFPPMKAFGYKIFSRVWAKRGNFEEAIKNDYLALAICQKYNMEYTVYEFQDELAQIFAKQNKSDSVRKYAQLALVGGLKLKNYLVIKSSAQLLAQIFEKNNPVEALRLFKLSISAKDTISNLEKTKQIQLLEIKEKQRVDDLKLAETETKNQIRWNAILGILGSVIIISLLQFRNNRRKQRANDLLHKQKTEIDLQKNKVEKTLSQLKSTQNQLIQKEKLASLGELTAGIAHEIQNPLNFVNNFSEVSVDMIDEVLEERKKEEGKRDIGLENELLNDVSQNLQKIAHHGKRASNIVKGMLEHSRTSTGERVLTDINQLADEYLRLSFHGMKAKNKDSATDRFEADYQLIADSTLPKIAIVPQEIGRVLLNLLNNAFYSIGQSPRLSKKVIVTTKKLENQIEISVKDNGNGIPEANLAKIFQPFFTTKPTGEGSTGLGLSLSYDIVTKGHDGTLEVISKEGEGAEFIVRLPA